jgi:glycosyltransferase involved in cell wall biosynthesis
MRIGIHTNGKLASDDSFIGYARNLSRALLAEIGPDDGLIHFDGRLVEPLSRTPLDLAGPIRPSLGVAQAVGTWWGGRDVEPAYYRKSVDVSHAIGALPLPAIDTPVIPLIRDLGPVRHPPAYSACAVNRFEQFLSHLDSYAGINTLSECTRDELVASTGIDPGRVIVTGIGVADLFRAPPARQDERDLQALGLLAGDFFLTVGTLHGLSNIRRLTDAYAALPDRVRAWLPLVVVGGRGRQAPRLSRAVCREIEAGNIRLLGQVSQSLLAVLYRNTRLALFPAAYGGAGLGVAEALVSGAPVAVSLGTPAAELAGGRAARVNPLDVDGWRSILAEHAERGRFGAVRARPSEGFRWSDVARRASAMYRSVATLGSAPHPPASRRTHFGLSCPA